MGLSIIIITHSKNLKYIKQEFYKKGAKVENDILFSLTSEYLNIYTCSSRENYWSRVEDKVKIRQQFKKFGHI